MSPPLTVWYNTKCPVCNAGIDWQRSRLVRAARAGLIEFRDINREPDALARFGAGIEDIRMIAVTRADLNDRRVAKWLQVSLGVRTIQFTVTIQRDAVVDVIDDADHHLARFRDGFLRSEFLRVLSSNEIVAARHPFLREQIGGG